MNKTEEKILKELKGRKETQMLEMLEIIFNVDNMETIDLCRRYDLLKSIVMDHAIFFSIV